MNNKSTSDNDIPFKYIIAIIVVFGIIFLYSFTKNGSIESSPYETPFKNPKATEMAKCNGDKCCLALVDSGSESEKANIAKNSYSCNPDKAVEATQWAQEIIFEQQCQLDECCHGIEMGTPSAFIDACGGSNDNSVSTNMSDSNDTCPKGCIAQISGCNIKGNISFEFEEKIYHLPGMKYYDQTTINPDYGERWFCTESEAIANGWRKGNDY